jgi:hypothetical protein
MANFTTVRDLRNDALWIAGESQTSASSYYARSLEYLNAALISLMSGGPLGAMTLPAVDWWWAYKTRRGSVAIENAVNTDSARSITLTQNNSGFTLSSTLSPLSLVGYRVVLTDDQDQMLYVSNHAVALQPETDETWKKATRTTSGWVAWKDQYALPSDFVRFTTPLKMGRWPYEVELTDYATLERKYPRSRMWLGTPQCAAIVNAGSGGLALHFSHMLQDGPIVCEFEYLFKQTELADSTGTEEPPMPHQHRRVLSLGAAYLMLFDKVDAKYAQVGKMFSDAWEAMAEEHYRQATDNENYGRILARQNEVAAKRNLLRSPSGFIYG